MPDSINNLLKGKFDEPPEIKSIKKYVKIKYKSDIGILVKDNQIILSVPNSALANTLRLEENLIKQAAGTDKRLVIRIGLQ